MAFIAATSITFPAYFYPQAELAMAMGEASSLHESEKSRINFLFHSTQVKGRYLTVPPEELKELNGFGSSNDKWIENATCLGQANLSQLLKMAALDPEEVSQITFASS